MGVWIISIVAIVGLVCVIVWSAVEVTKDVRRWIRILKAAAEDERREQAGDNIIFFNPKGEPEEIVEYEDDWDDWDEELDA